MNKSSILNLLLLLLSTTIYANDRVINEANYQCPSNFIIHNGESVIINGNLIINAPDKVEIQDGGELIVKGNVVIWGVRNSSSGNPHNSYQKPPVSIVNSGNVVIGGNVDIHDDTRYEARGTKAALAVLGEYVNAYGSSSSHGWRHISNQINGTPGTHNYIGDRLKMNAMAGDFFGNKGHNPPVRITNQNKDQIPAALQQIIKDQFPNSQASKNLPIELITFEGFVNDTEIELQWSTATEENNSHFTIEKSYDGRNFKTISDNIKGAGNSATLNDYSFVDDDLQNGRIYYRLTQTDFDGKNESWVTVVNFHNDSDKVEVISIYPDPADYQLSVIIHHFDNDVFTFKIIHVESGSVYELIPLYPMQNEKVMFNVSNYTSGAYVLEIFNHGQAINKSEIIIQH
ncbi:hypothetical protein [Flammeovirga sp. SubArs3]|uniref:hypothetical protein n=1 Tax=Flammeovirga sp. SubArs3 TaxID=2995316 RepID=UPI00248C9761|nr:hypothetical protein [Flammeovirga sp. SubArs3]